MSERPSFEPRLVLYWYGWRDFWWRHGHMGAGWSVSPDHHLVDMGDGRLEPHTPFTERMGIEPAHHVLGLCIKRLRSSGPPAQVGLTFANVITSAQAKRIARWALERWQHPGWYSQGEG